jgi:hypothetical protein
LRTFAIVELFPITDAVDKIVLTRMYGMEDWLENAYMDVCLAANLPSDVQSEALGFPTFRKIARAREVLNICQVSPTHVPDPQHCNVVTDMFCLRSSPDVCNEDKRCADEDKYPDHVPEPTISSSTSYTASGPEAERQGPASIMHALKEARLRAAEEARGAEQAELQLRAKEDERRVHESKDRRMMEELQEMKEVFRSRVEQVRNFTQEAERWQAKYKACCEAGQRPTLEVEREKQQETLMSVAQEAKAKAVADACKRQSVTPDTCVTEASTQRRTQDINQLYSSVGSMLNKPNSP